MFHKKFLKVAGLVALAASAQVSQADVLNFDDLTGTGPQGPAFDWFKADYHGFRFGNNSTLTNTWFHTDESDLLQPLPEYTPSSGNRYASTCFPDALTCPLHTGAPLEETLPIIWVDPLTSIVFNGAFFSGFDKIAYKLYNNGSLVFDSSLSPLPASPLETLPGVPQFIASGYAGLVDEVRVLGTQGFFAMDDFSYNVVGGTVPEPGSLALVTLAGLMVAATRRKALFGAK